MYTDIKHDNSPQRRKVREQCKVITAWHNQNIIYHEAHEGHEELFLYLTQSRKGLKKDKEKHEKVLRLCLLLCAISLCLCSCFIVFFFVIFVCFVV